MKWQIIHSLYRSFQAESEVAIKKFQAGLISRETLKLALKEADKRLTENLNKEVI